MSLGTLAAIGLSQSHVPFKRAITAVLISPMIVPLIISATGMFFFYSHVGNFLEDTLGLDKNFTLLNPNGYLINSRSNNNCLGEENSGYVVANPSDLDNFPRYFYDFNNKNCWWC